MLRKKKLFVRPKKAFESVRIKEENIILKKYGLKTKREIWKSLARVNYFRRRAKDLARSSREDQEVFLSKLKALGLNTNSLADVLNLKVENLLERKLATVLVRKKLASTPKQARQFIVHKKVIVGGNVINIPNYIVPLNLEHTIVVKKSSEPVKAKEESSENKEESENAQEEN